MPKYIVSTQVTAHLSYSVEAEDEEGARQIVGAALNGTMDLSSAAEVLSSLTNEINFDSDEIVEEAVLDNR